MLPVPLRRPAPIRRRLAAAVLAPFVLALAAPAAGLSRAMWAEFNAIYLINLKPAAECRAYRTRSIDLLKDTTLSPVALDERMHALWDEAKANCLAKPAPEQPAIRQPRPPPAAGEPRTTVAQASTPAPAVATTAAGPAEAAPVPVPVKSAAVPLTPAVAQHPAARSAPAPAPAAAPTAAPAPGPAQAPVPPAASPAAVAPPLPADVAKVAPEPATPTAHVPATVTAGRGNAAPGMPMQSTPGTKPPADGRPAIALPQLKPAIEHPQTVDLRLEAACAKRNPYAYQVASDDDPCARLAKSKAAAAAPAEAGAAPEPERTPAWVWGVAVVALSALGGGGAWLWRRRRRRAVKATAAADDVEDGEIGRDRQQRNPPRPADDDGAPELPHGEPSLAPALP